MSEATELQTVAIHAGGSLDHENIRERPPLLQKEIITTKGRPGRLGVDQGLVYAHRSNNEFAYVGVLMGLRYDADAGGLRYEGYRPLAAPVTVVKGALDIDLMKSRIVDVGFGPGAYSYLPAGSINLVQRLGELAARPDLPKRLALDLARRIGLSKPICAIARDTSNARAVQKRADKVLRKLVSDTLENEPYTNGLEMHLDHEGEARDDIQRRSYSLLGTGSHPDAAVLFPVRIAIELGADRSARCRAT